MRAFVPDPSMVPWIQWVEALVGSPSWFNTPLSNGGVGTPRGAYIVAPALPPEPTDPEQRAFYLNVVVPMNEMVNAFNARVSAEAAAEDAFAQQWFQQQSSSAP